MNGHFRGRWIAAAAVLTAATAVQIAIAVIVLTRPGDEEGRADGAQRTTVPSPSADDQPPAATQALPFAAREKDFYRRGSAGSRAGARSKIARPSSTKGDRPKPRTVPSPREPSPPPATTVARASSPPPPPATTAARTSSPPPSPAVTSAAAERPPPTVPRRPVRGVDDDDDDDEEEDGDDDDEDEDDGGEDDEGGDDGGEDD